ncbi:precorrin-6y C5,15-methyltransferase (decarboxylating) subunit CbiE [Angustibacter sp. McL0619]|uniref:precorrin-6y C5,15-methyltransferase (decarboxylating) subunit CbiE n=1 Tax=Angustibacter sp. McL0619 TaxID=3415676 RepID=UPI003CF7A91B
MGQVIDVVGIGSAGWAELGSTARTALSAAAVVLGSERQLALLPGDLRAERVPFPHPLLPGLIELVERHSDRGLVVLASGDPSWHGLATTLGLALGWDAVRIHPAPSSLSLACARLGWPAQDVSTVSLLTGELPTLVAALQPGRRLLVLLPTPADLSAVSDLLRSNGFGASSLTLLADLGGPDESVRRGLADDPPGPAGRTAVAAVECRVTADTTWWPTTAGLPDEAFEHDGQLTKRDLRASALSRLGPAPGQLLWDVGAGAGSVGIEWMRHHPTCRAIAVERDSERADRLQRNASRLGVPGLQVVCGSAPRALAGLAVPDAVFVGGGATTSGLLDACWDALTSGGRLVVHAVTAESEAALVSRRAALGGELVRIGVEHLEPLGGFSGWRPARAVTQWAVAR